MGNASPIVVGSSCTSNASSVITDLPIEIVNWFVDRGISEETLTAEKIGYSNGWIQFPFYKEEEVVNIKYRKVDKSFKQEKNAEKCFFHVRFNVFLEYQIRSLQES